MKLEVNHKVQHKYDDTFAHKSGILTLGGACSQLQNINIVNTFFIIEMHILKQEQMNASEHAFARTHTKIVQRNIIPLGYKRIIEHSIIT